MGFLFSKLEKSCMDFVTTEINFGWIWKEHIAFLWTGSESQLVCSGCRNLLLYPIGATSVCCAVCNSVTAVPLPGMYKKFGSFLYIF